MNIFDKMVSRDWDAARRLGCPAATEAERLRRVEAMAAMNPSGFRTPAKQPRRDAQGKTRGDRKREARTRTNAKIKAEQSRAAKHGE